MILILPDIRQSKSRIPVPDIWPDLRLNIQKSSKIWNKLRTKDVPVLKEFSSSSKHWIFYIKAVRVLRRHLEMLEIDMVICSI
jgi:hypothetical protein